MTLYGDAFKVKIHKDEDYRIDSTIESHYDAVLNPYGLDHNTYFETLSVTVDNYSNEKHLAIMGQIISDDYGAAILNGCDLILLIDSMLIVIDCKSIEVKIQKEMPEGYYFSIHNFNNGYIIHGELDIIKLTSAPAFEVEWTFSGNDIFVTPDGRSSFQINNDVFYLKDWNDKEYVVDKNGKEL